MVISTLQKLKSEVAEKAPLMQQVTEDGSAILTAGGTGSVQELGKTLVRLGEKWERVKVDVDAQYTRLHKAMDNWATCKGGKVCAPVCSSYVYRTMKCFCVDYAVS